jgi:hypothetical protein
MSLNKCQEINCNTRPTYNFKNETKAIYCAKHKQIGMIDIKSKRCFEDNCFTQPVYNYKNESHPLYCFKHKKEEMVDVKNRKCLEKDCNKQPAFNYKDKLKGDYCFIHKKEEMVNIKTKQCCENDCNIRPSFNYKDENIPLYCSKHKKEEMINIVNDNKCKKENCNIHASFNFKEERKAIYCKIHKQNGMINVNHNICIVDSCKKRPSFNYINEKEPIYCVTHKKDNMIDIIHKKCKTEFCNTIPSNKIYEGYCLRCFVYLFPDKPNSRNYKTKEISVVEYIQKEFQNKTIITDKKIQDGCSRRRPDILIDLGYQVIIIEVDENQHIDYDCSCENKRIMELSQDIGHRPLIFIRFNPDEYLDKNNNKITSCWGIDGRDICSIKKSKIKEWNERLDRLKEQIQYWIDNESNKIVEIIQLYYNQNISN